jgi:AcrR family transcriptional regulator
MASSPVDTALRTALRESGESIRTLAARHSLNPKTVAKWRGRPDPADRPRGPRRSAALAREQEAAILAFRRYLPLSLDDSMALLGPRFPALSRSALHRLFRRHGLSRPVRPAGLPEAARRPGCFHIVILPVAIGERDHYVFFAVEQATGLIFGLMMPDATQASARNFLDALADGSPGPVRLVLTSDRFQFTTPGNAVSGVADVREAMEKGTLARAHPFEYACAARGIDHHLVPEHFPWGAEQAELVSRITRGLVAIPDETLAHRSLHLELARHNNCPLPSLGGLSAGEALATGDRAILLRDDLVHAPAPPRRRDSTREAILEAARGRLARDGPEGLSLSEVARVAGVSRGTAYQHFKTRDRLIEAAGQWMAERLRRSVFPDHGGGRGSAEGGIAGIAGRLAAFAMDDPELCRAWLLQLLAAPDPMQDPFWRDYSAAMAQAGTGDGIDREVASVAMLAGAFLWPVLGRGATVVDNDAAARRFAREWLRIARGRG